MTLSSELLRRAEQWLDGDPDPSTRAELSALIAAGDAEQLESRLTPLTFGTAGLRGAVGAGSGRMNLAVVLRTAYGVARYLAEDATLHGRPVVVGFDARPTSRSFAEASVGVLRAAGCQVIAFREAVATPLCAFVGRERRAAATIVVTASHNPRGDNGYKVYGPNAVQIISPTDALIAGHVADAPAARLVPRASVDLAGDAPPGLELLWPNELDAYFSELSRALPPGRAARELRIVHSALHGVGTAPMRRALSEAGFSRVSSVPEQAAPDGTFPTTPFPNPEEPGTLDLALAESERVSADLLLVSDPDADRLAAAARLGERLCVLDGNQLGALLADACLSRRASGRPRALVLSSVVSSPLVTELAMAHGAHAERTLTGFKWLWNAALALEQAGAGEFCFAYEEALGYSVFAAVRDKDGIAAGRALAERAAELAGAGKSLFQRLHELYAEYGLWASAALNVGLGAQGLPVAARLDAVLAAENLALGSRCVRQAIDYRSSAESRAPWLGVAPLVELVLDDDSRVFLRPSGTEPKLKLYGHVRRSITLEGDLWREVSAARSAALELLEAVAGFLAERA